MGDVEIDRCAQCGGTWFDRGELQKAKDATDPDLSWMDFDLWREEDHFQISPGARPCPKCQVPMATIAYGDTGVEIDVCPQCQGIWLDQGEFERIVEALEQEVETKSVPDYVRASLEEAREVISGPERTASEWRDLATVLRLFEYRLLVEKPRLRNAVLAIQQAGKSF
jgi:Zn-finger nucleic acid-binding protein